MWLAWLGLQGEESLARSAGFAECGPGYKSILLRSDGRQTYENLVENGSLEASRVQSRSANQAPSRVSSLDDGSLPLPRCLGPGQQTLRHEEVHFMPQKEQSCYIVLPTLPAPTWGLNSVDKKHAAAC